MGKRGWNIRVVQILLLSITLCLLLPVLAPSVSSAPARKGKASTVANTPNTQPPSSANSQSDQQLNKKAQPSKSSAKSLPQKHKRNVKIAVNTKHSTRVRSRTPTKSAALSAKRRSQPKVAFAEDDDQGVVSGSAFAPETAPFLVQLNGERLPYRINSVFVLPAERLTLAVGAVEGN